MPEPGTPALLLGNPPYPAGSNIVFQWTYSCDENPTLPRLFTWFSMHGATSTPALAHD